MKQPYSPPYPPQSAAQPVKTKKKRWPWIVVGVVALLFVIGIATGGGKPGTGDAATGVPAGNEVSSSAAPAAEQQPAAKAAATERTVIYKVTGTGKASSLTYTTDGMTSTNQEADVKLPWTKTLKLPAGEAFQMVSLMAQGSGKGELKAAIEVDGTLFKEASAQGYGIAMANGNIGSLG